MCNLKFCPIPFKIGIFARVFCNVNIIADFLPAKWAANITFICFMWNEDSCLFYNPVVAVSLVGGVDVFRGCYGDVYTNLPTWYYQFLYRGLVVRTNWLVVNICVISHNNNNNINNSNNNNRGHEDCVRWNTSLLAFIL